MRRLRAPASVPRLEGALRRRGQQGVAVAAAVPRLRGGLHARQALAHTRAAVQRLHGRARLRDAREAHTMAGTN